MDIQTILTIIGITLTGFLGAWAILVAFRSIKSVEITYIEDRCISLIDDITQSFSELNISYKNQAVSKNLVLLKGYLINTGRKDISEEMVEEDISLNLPDDFEWLDCKIVDTSKSLKASISKIDKSRIELDIGLWKIKEYCRFDALAKVPVIELDEDKLELNGEKPNERLWKALTFTHRIADLSKIQVTEVPQMSKNRFPFPRAKFLAISAVSVILAGIVTIVLTFLTGLFVDKTVGYNMKLNGENRLVSVKIKKESIIVSDKKGFSKNLSIDEFNSIKDKQAGIISQSRENLFRFLGSVYILMGLIILIPELSRKFREKRILNLITSKG